MMNGLDKKFTSLLKRNENEQLIIPLYEIFYNHESEVLINDSFIISLGLASTLELKFAHKICTKINVVLKSFFERRGFILNEFNCYFGKYEDKVFVTGDFSPKSIKIFSKDHKSINPYKINSSYDFKKYTDLFLDLIKS